MSKHVLLDRDGVINRRVLNGYVTSWEQFVFLPDALAALRLLTQSRYKTLVVSNQACVGKGLMSAEQLAELTWRFVAVVEKNGGRIDGVYYCPHRAEDRCECRKPEAGLLRRAQREHGFIFAETFLVGDSEGDLAAAHEVGSPAVLVATEGTYDSREWPHSPQAIVPGLYDAVEFILGAQGEKRRTG